MHADRSFSYTLRLVSPLVLTFFAGCSVSGESTDADTSSTSPAEATSSPGEATSSDEGAASTTGAGSAATTDTATSGVETTDGSDTGEPPKNYVPYTMTVDIGGQQKLTAHVLDSAIPAERARWLVQMADLSTATRSPATVNPATVNGMMEPDDQVVVTHKLLIWFSFSGDFGGVINGGSGFIRGVWPLREDASGNLNFARIQGEGNWAPNEFLPGSDGERAQGSGVSLLLGLGNINEDVLNPYAMVAEAAGVKDFWLGAVPIDDGGWGDGEGFFFQSGAKLVHAELDQGILSQYGYDSVFDVNPESGVESTIDWVLTHRIIPDSDTIHTTLSLATEGSTAGPIASFGISHNTPGSNGLEHLYFQASRGFVEGNGCDREPTIPANTPFEFGSSDTLRWWENAKLKDPGALTSFSRTSDFASGMSIEILLDPPFEIPDHITIVHNNYSAAPLVVHAYDLQYSDVNQCGGNIFWEAGTTRYLGTMLRFF